MKLSDAISKVHAPQGASTLIAAFATGQFDPIRGESAAGAAIGDARERLKRVEDAQSKANSDWAWWGYNGEIAYWRSVVSLLEAAEIVGADNLPDVQLPCMQGPVMDVQYNVEKWGSDVLEAAQKKAGLRA